jgi:hypothetical protein
LPTPQRLFHAAYGEDEVHMFEVWDSPDQFDAHSDRLFAVIQGAGVDAGTVNVHPLHSPATPTEPRTRLRRPRQACPTSGR